MLAMFISRFIRAAILCTFFAALQATLIGNHPYGPGRWATLAGSGNSISIPSGETALIVYSSQNANLQFTFGGEAAVTSIVPQTNSGGPSVEEPLPIAGPATITIDPNGPNNTGMVVGMIIIGTEIPALREGIPSTAVVVPIDNSGNVDEILESSTDLITWTPANSGVFDTSEQKRFFRLRTVRVGD